MSKDLTNEEHKPEIDPNTPTQSFGETSTKRKTSDAFGDWETYKNAPIEVNVHKPVLREELFSRYLVYKIQGNDAKGYFEVSRRYSDFEKIRHLLVIRWPGCFVPALPPKKINNMEKSIIDDRRKYLDDFCKQIAELPHLHYADAYQIFLRTRMVDLDPLLGALGKVKHEDIVRRYSVVFSHLSGKEFNTDVVHKITTFSAFLTRVQGLFDKYKKIGKKFVAARKDFTVRLVAFHKMMSEDYEKNVFSEYHGQVNEKNVFMDPTNEKMNSNIEKVKELQSLESVELIYEWIKSEQRDIAAFSEAFVQREKFESLKGKVESKQRSEAKDFQNLAAGKKTLKTLFTPTPKEGKEQTLAKLEEKISNASKDIETLTNAQDIITLVLAYEEIDRFKASRQEKYNKLLQLTAKNELECFNAILEYWNGVTEHATVQATEN